MTLRRRLLMTTACGLGILLLGNSAQAQTIGEGQTVNVSTLGTSATPTFNGGTLVVDKPGTYANNFDLDTATATQPANMLDAHGNTATFSGIFADAVSGLAGNITVQDSVGGGTASFTGISTYTGPTTINSGVTLALAGSGSISNSQYVLDDGTLDISGITSNSPILSLSGAGNVVLGNQTLIIADAGSGYNTFTGTISGAGSLSVTGGLEILDGTNTYTGGTTITSGGALQIGNDDTAGSIQGNISNAGNLSFERTDSVTFSGTISGAGGVNQFYGTLTFNTPQPYTGTTTINSGTLALAGSGSIASSSSLADNGTFDISATTGASIQALSGTGNINLGAATLTITAGSGIFSGAINGTGGLVLANGNEILNGANTYTGGTTVSAGTLQIGNGATTGSVVGNIADSGTVAFDYANAQTFSGVISGSGGFQLVNGTLTLEVDQAYTGLTTISAGTLALSDGTNISQSQGVIVNGELDISQTNGATITSLSGTGIVQLGSNSLTITNAAGTFSGLIEGGGALTIASGNQVLSGTNTYTGTTTIASGATLGLTSLSTLATSPIIDNGTLDISSAINNLSNIVTVDVSSLTGSGQVTLGSSNLTLTNAAGIFSGVISGTGGLTVAGGTAILTNANTYTGTTTIGSGATLVLTGAGSLAVSAIADNGTLDVSSASTSVTFASLSGTGTLALGSNSLTLNNAVDNFGGTITGTGGLVISGGTEVLSGTNTYTGGTIITSGATLQLGNAGSGGTIVGNVSVGNTSTLAFDYSGSATFSGVISGAGGVNQLGGTTILTAPNTYSGGTTITAGTLELGNGGSISGAVVDNGTLAFNQSGNLTFSGTISGSGGVSQLGSGILVLNGANTYTGTTTIANGATLAIGTANSIAQSGNVSDNGVLDVSGTSSPQISSLSGSGTVRLGSQSLQITNGNGSFSGVMSGAGNLSINGGTQTLAGVNTYTGTTTINGGTLAVTGSIASSSGVTVNSGGTLAGTGTVSNVIVASGGTIAAGSGGSGTLNINGSAGFANGSKLLVSMSSTSSTLVDVSGAANLGGTIAVQSSNGTYALGQQLTVLTAAGGVSGSFTAGAVPNNAGGAEFSSTISQSANDVYLTVNLAKLSPLLPNGSSLNATNAVAGIDAAIAHGDTLPQTFENLANVSSATLATDAQQMAGELGGDIPQVGNTLFNPFQDAVFAHLADIGDLPRTIRQTAVPTRPGPWLTLLAGTNVLGGDTEEGSQKFSASAVGFAGGADWQLSPNLVLGGALSLGSAHFHIGDGLGQGKATAYQFAVYGLMHFTRRIYGSFMAAIGEDPTTTARSVSATENDTLAASVTSQVYDLRYETGINLGWITPYIGAEDRLLSAPSYSETGSTSADNFALSYASHNVNIPDLELGFRNAAELPLSRYWVLHLTDKFGVEHTANNSFDAQASYAALSDSNFTAFGAQPGKNLARFSLGAEFKSRYGAYAGITFDAAASSRSQTYNGIFSLGYGW